MKETEKVCQTQGCGRRFKTEFPGLIRYCKVCAEKVYREAKKKYGGT